MGKKADALRVVNEQTGEYLAVTREMVGLDEDGSSVGIEVRVYDRAGRNLAVWFADSVDHARQLMLEATSQAATRLLGG